jgi:ferredoxin
MCQIYQRNLKIKNECYVMSEEKEFKIKIASTGDTYLVPVDRTILDVLWENGIEHEFGCGEGMCQTCLTKYLEGEVDHRDVLGHDELDRDNYLTVCKSRAISDLLILDL